MALMHYDVGFTVTMGPGEVVHWSPGELFHVESVDGPGLGGVTGRRDRLLRTILECSSDVEYYLRTACNPGREFVCTWTRRIKPSMRVTDVTCLSCLAAL